MKWKLCCKTDFWYFIVSCPWSKGGAATQKLSA